LNLSNTTKNAVQDFRLLSQQHVHATCLLVYTVVYGVCACIGLIKGNKTIKMLGVSNFKERNQGYQ